MLRALEALVHFRLFKLQVLAIGRVNVGRCVLVRNDRTALRGNAGWPAVCVDVGGSGQPSGQFG
eukprot:12502724-Alexandrium_andersonii.AAC.1